MTVSPSRLAKSTPVGTDRNRADQAIDAGVLGVGHGHAPADAGAAQFFTLQNRFDNALELGRIDSLGVDQRLDHLADGPFLVERRHVRANRVAADKVGKLHAPISLSYGITRFHQDSLNGSRLEFSRPPSRLHSLQARLRPSSTEGWPGRDFRRFSLPVSGAAMAVLNLLLVLA